MPAGLMYDGCNPHLFDDYAAVAQRTGVYTAADYTDILEHLIARWQVASREGLSPEAQHAQEFVCSLPVRMRRLAEREMERARKARGGKTRREFSWVFDRPVAVI